jgi:predicted transglutaminase-like cysteine proteinase
MKHFVFFAAMAISMTAFAQAPAQTKPEPIKAEPIKAEPAKAKATKPVKHTNRRQEDARQCLERPTNTEIIKCAEEYL